VSGLWIQFWRNWRNKHLVWLCKSDGWGSF
jgi:hypothetical protein